MQGIRRMEGCFHPALGNVTRGCFFQLKCYFWQGSGRQAGGDVGESLG